VIAALIAAVGYGGVGVMLSFAKDSHLDGTVILAWRFTVTALLLWVLRGFRHGSFKSANIRQLTAGLLLGGVLYASQCYTYFIAVGELGAGKTAVILYTYPAMVIVYHWLKRDSQPNLRTILLLMLAMAGTSLTVYQPGGQSSPFGLVLAFTTAFIYTVYLLASARFTIKLMPEDAATIVSTGAAIAFWGLSFTFSDRLAPSYLYGWLTLGTMAIFCTLIPLIAAFAAVKALGPERTALICMLEPVVATWLGYAILNEGISWPQIIGTVLVIATSYALQTKRSQSKSPEKEPDLSTLPNT
jgi:drug/metabolite transporter (DMT)-like permease